MVAMYDGIMFDHVTLEQGLQLLDIGLCIRNHLCTLAGYFISPWFPDVFDNVF
jgi:hypothetical protein